MKTITLHAGHNPKGKIACGASDYLDESTEARILVKKLKRVLAEKKIKVYDCTVNNGKNQRDILQKIVANCNSKKRDFDISIHFNACKHSTSDGKTKGVECHVYNINSEAAKLAADICYNVSKLGFRNRGVVQNRGLYFINHTSKPSILIEICFVDDQDDAKLYQSCKNKVAHAIADAIC